MGWFKSSTFTTTQLTKQKNVKKGNNLNLFSLFNRINTTIHCLNSSFSKTSLIAPLSRNILARRAHCWCLAINLTCLIFPKVIVLVRLAGNHLCTMSPVYKLASVGVRGCVQIQSGVQLCSLDCSAPGISRLRRAASQVSVQLNVNFIASWAIC